MKPENARQKAVWQDPGAATRSGSARRQDVRSQPTCPPRPDGAASTCFAGSAGTGKHGCCDRQTRCTVSVAARCGKTSAETQSVRQQEIFALSCLLSRDGNEAESARDGLGLKP